MKGPGLPEEDEGGEARDSRKKDRIGTATMKDWKIEEKCGKNI